MRYATWRVDLDPPPLDGPRTVAELRAAAGQTITAGGIGGLEALRIFADVLAPACISVDHPRFLSFVPAAPTDASILFDLVVGASSIYGGSWLEGGGAVFAENEALRWIADLAGMPATAGGVFVSGGTAGNLSALIAARWQWRRRAEGRHDRTRGLLITSGRRPLLGGPGCPGDGRRRGGSFPLTPAAGSRPTPCGRLVGALDEADSRPRLRRRRHVRHDERRCDRRPDGRRRRGRRDLAHVAARRRCLRRRGAGRAERPRPLRRDRGCRQLHRRSAQVAVRAVRLVRPALPRPRDRPSGPHPARRVPRRAARRRPTSSGTPRTTPTTCPAGPAACRCGSAWRRTARRPTPMPSRRRCASPARVPPSCARRPPRAAPRTGAVGRAVPPDRLGRRPATRHGATGNWRPSSRS